MKKVIIFILIFLNISFVSANNIKINNSLKTRIDNVLDKVGYKPKLYNFFINFKKKYTGKHKEILNYIIYKISLELDKKYNLELDNIKKDYFIFENIKAYLREDLNFDEKQEVIEILKNIKKESKNLQKELEDIFKLKITEEKRKVLVIGLEKKVINHFDKWQAQILKFVKNKDLYRAYEAYILHSYFGKVHHYLLKPDQRLWLEGFDVTYKRPKSKDYNFEEVKKHNIKKDCWTVIDGKIYNITPFFGHHAGGGRALMILCGKDGSQVMHWAHNFLPEITSILEKLYIGKLIK